MKFATGWLRDFADPRDYSVDSDAIVPFLLRRETFGNKEGKKIPNRYMIPSLSTIKDQGELGSCTAFAATTMYETYLNIANLKGGLLSPRFLYKVTRNLMGEKGDSGAYLRTTMQAMAMFGVPPEQYFKYDIKNYNLEPTGFHYAIAQNYQALTYYRLDRYGKSEKTIASIKVNLAANRACMFGFVCYSNLGNSPDILLPGPADRAEGGHAICAVGYNDVYKIGSCTGAFRIANSWGEGWGEGGYGWLPYDYVRQGLATDWWTVMKAEWLSLECFK